MSLRVFSFGGGVQSTAALVLAVSGQIDFHTFLFANVGDNAENPDTLEYVRSISMPYARDHGIEIHEIRREYRDERGWTLYDKLMESKRSIGIPVRLSGSGAPARRNCTQDFKINVIAKWLREHGATSEDKAVSGLGISLDEFHRMRSDSGIPWQSLEYPLVDLRLDRSNCEAIIQRAELPVPPKSSCFFCPYHSLATWRELKQTRPDLFKKAVELEHVLSERGEAIGSGPVFMTDAMMPLEQAVGPHVQMSIWAWEVERLLEGKEETPCESGYCMT